MFHRLRCPTLVLYLRLFLCLRANTDINLFNSLRCKFLYTKVHLKPRLLSIYLLPFDISLLWFSCPPHTLDATMSESCEIMNEPSTECAENKNKLNVLLFFIRSIQTKVSLRLDEKWKRRNGFGVGFVCQCIQTSNVEMCTTAPIPYYIQKRMIDRVAWDYSCSMTAMRQTTIVPICNGASRLKYYCHIVNRDKRTSFHFRSSVSIRRNR